MRSDRIHVRPKAGLQIFDPMTRRPIPEDGAVVARTPYWLRRLRDGDVELEQHPEAEVLAEQIAAERSPSRARRAAADKE